MEPESEFPWDAGRATPTPQRRDSRPLTSVENADLLSLNFACPRKSRSMLNCTVVGRDGYTPYFHIVTHAADPERTLFRTNEGRNLAVVGWGGEGSTSYVEIFRTVTQQPVSKWLILTYSASCRLMYAFGNTYVWAPRGDFV
ncbi:hypothetical protein B0H11DRAFT_1724112 [Mycena galericulata]|nr:hypothetical protein B0H11DRAFT_1724112 [Mycena galericulata]